MSDTIEIDNSLYLPLLGRIYTTEKLPKILYDEKALELKDRIPENLEGSANQTQYSLLACATRSVNIDRYIQEFIENNPNGVIVRLSCGLDTAFYRNNNDKTKWYEIDTANNINARKELLGESEKDICIASDPFSEDWIKTIRESNPESPIMITATGFFHYYHYNKVINFFKMLKKYGNIEIVFDTVNSVESQQLLPYIKSFEEESKENIDTEPQEKENTPENEITPDDDNSYFCVDSALAMTEDAEATLINEEPFFSHINRKGLKFMTKTTMKYSDAMKMEKMEHIKIN